MSYRDFLNTLPGTQYVADFPRCTGPCGQGDRPCPTPDACCLYDDDAAAAVDREYRAQFWRFYLFCLAVAAWALAVLYVTGAF